MNQVLNVSKELNPGDKPPLDYFMTNNVLLNNLGSDAGISAMSISDMTQIPRATIIRKCKFLIKNDLIKINEKKQYVLTTMNFKKILPYQTEEDDLYCDHEGQPAHLGASTKPKYEDDLSQDDLRNAGVHNSPQARHQQ